MGKEGFDRTLYICDWHIPALMIRTFQKYHWDYFLRKPWTNIAKNPMTCKNYCIIQDDTNQMYKFNCRSIPLCCSYSSCNFNFIYNIFQNQTRVCCSLKSISGCFLPKHKCIFYESLIKSAPMVIATESNWKDKQTVERFSV